MEHGPNRNIDTKKNISCFFSFHKKCEEQREREREIYSLLFEAKGEDVYKGGC